MKIFAVIEDLHYEYQALVAVCATLESAKNAAQRHNDQHPLANEDEESRRPQLAEWVEGDLTRSLLYFRDGAKGGSRLWSSKGVCRSYQVFEMEVLE